MSPAYYRLVLDWPSLEPSKGDLSLERPQGGCLRDRQPCLGWNGVRDQLKALAERQEESGGWEALVVVSGTPDWAARPAKGCERGGTQPRSRAPRTEELASYQALIRAVNAEARGQGAELRYWSPWNEPNHPYFLSPQRTRCSGKAAITAVKPYVQLARAMQDALADGQELVLGELAGLTKERRPSYAAIGEFIAALPEELVCATAVFGQHGYVGGPDPVESAAGALAAFGCPESHQIWVTETGVGGVQRGAERARDAKGLRQACRRMRKRLNRWYRDPRVSAAFQYTLREDDRFPSGLVATDLSDGYPTLAEWKAWGARERPQDPPPASSCS